MKPEPKTYICPTHKCALERRDKKRQSYEQLFCGEWWDCPKGDYTVLEESAAVKAQNAEGVERIRVRADNLPPKERAKYVQKFAPWIQAELAQPKELALALEG